MKFCSSSSILFISSTISDKFWSSVSSPSNLNLGSPSTSGLTSDSWTSCVVSVVSSLTSVSLSPTVWLSPVCSCASTVSVLCLGMASSCVLINDSSCGLISYTTVPYVELSRSVPVASTPSKPKAFITSVDLVSLFSLFFSFLFISFAMSSYGAFVSRSIRLALSDISSVFASPYLLTRASYSLLFLTKNSW